MKFNLSIGIPALNEEANIGYLLRSLISQAQKNFILKEIVVVSDGSRDRTAEVSRRVNDKRVTVIEHSERKGQAVRQDEIIEKTKGVDLLLLMNADMLPESNLFLENLVNPFYNSNNLGLVSGKGVPLPAVGKFEDIVNFGVNLKEKMVAGINGGDNVYNSHGHTRVFSKSFLEKFKFGSVVSEDAYSYVYCKKNGFGFKYASDAVVNYRSPQTLKDHLKQSVRFIQGQKQLAELFGASYIYKLHKIPVSLVLKTCIMSFYSHPIKLISYCCILFISFITSKFRKQAVLKWEPAESSKKLIV